MAHRYESQGRAGDPPRVLAPFLPPHDFSTHPCPVFVPLLILTSACLETGLQQYTRAAWKHLNLAVKGNICGQVYWAGLIVGRRADLRKHTRQARGASGSLVNELSAAGLPIAMYSGGPVSLGHLLLLPK